jgi:deoxyribodipyrimidine photo-lyase
MKVCIFWFRRDLRIHDNVGFTAALKGNTPVIPLFIFDDDILKELPKNDARVQFVHQQLTVLNGTMNQHKSGLLVKKGRPMEVWESLFSEFDIETIYTNGDYEPYALERDEQMNSLCEKNNAVLHVFKDQVIFEKNEVLKDDGLPYTIFTPFKRKWLLRLQEEGIPSVENPQLFNLYSINCSFPSLGEIGFEPNSIVVPSYNLNLVTNYENTRDFPAVEGTSYLSTHLRFGTVGIRDMVRKAFKINPVFLSELIWREFFMQVLYHFPRVVNNNFRPKYDGIQWRNNTAEFQQWCDGNTGYPMVDAGMRQLNETGLMHNRVRMVTASFLCKHLLIDWRWGEAYFAEKLLDYDLSANNGNWQWAAGTGCDAAPYFRIFNPSSQLKKFDSELKYTLKWVPEYEDFGYPEPMVDHKIARERALATYKAGIEAYTS